MRCACPACDVRRHIVYTRIYPTISSMVSILRCVDTYSLLVVAKKQNSHSSLPNLFHHVSTSTLPLWQLQCRTWVLCTTFGALVVSRHRLDQFLQSALVAHLLPLVHNIRHDQGRLHKPAQARNSKPKKCEYARVYREQKSRWRATQEKERRNRVHTLWIRFATSKLVSCVLDCGSYPTGMMTVSCFFNQDDPLCLSKIGVATSVPVRILDCDRARAALGAGTKKTTATTTAVTRGR